MPLFIYENLNNTTISRRLTARYLGAEDFWISEILNSPRKMLILRMHGKVQQSKANFVLCLHKYISCCLQHKQKKLRY